MAWKLKRIGMNKDRVALSVREGLETSGKADDGRGRGYGATASAIESALQAFGSVNGQAIEVETAGDISVDGRGYLTISMRTIDPDVMV